MGHRFRTGTPAFPSFLVFQFKFCIFYERSPRFSAPAKELFEHEDDSQGYYSKAKRRRKPYSSFETRRQRVGHERNRVRVFLVGINYAIASASVARRCGNKPFSRAHVSIQEEL